MKNAGLISLGGYLPGNKIPEKKVEPLINFLNKKTLLPKEYIEEIRKTGNLPGKVETNHDGWESKPWFEAWVKSLPPKKQGNPFQGTKERRRVPMDPLSIRESVIPHPMLPSDAETIAGALAILNANCNSDEIDLVLSHAQVPDLHLPNNSCLIQDKLRLKNAGAYGVDTCCSSFVTMIEIAESLVRSGVKNKVLIVSSYIDSHINDKSEYFSVDTGDAAIAGLVSHVGEGFGYVNSFSNSHGNRHSGIILKVRPPKLLRKTTFGPSYEQTFCTFDNLEICKEIAGRAQVDMAEAVEKLFDKAHVKLSDIDFFVTHQPVSWAGNAWREAIGIPREKFYESFQKYGNIATAAAGTNLLEAVELGLIKKGTLLLIASSGAGENHIGILERISPQLIESNFLA